MNAWGLPDNFQFENYYRVWEFSNFSQYFINSFIVVITSVILTIIISIPCSYVLVKSNYKIKNVILNYFVIGMAIPIPLLYIPLYVMMAALRLSDSLLGLCIVYVAASLPVTIYLMTGYFSTLPHAIYEAAILDGSSAWNTFINIVTPIVKPGILTCSLLNFIWLWNEYQLSLVLLTSNEKFPVQLGLYALQNAMQYSGDWPGLFAGVTIVMLPTAILFFFLSKFIISGMTAGAVK